MPQIGCSVLLWQHFSSNAVLNVLFIIMTTFFQYNQIMASVHGKEFHKGPLFSQIFLSSLTCTGLPHASLPWTEFSSTIYLSYPTIKSNLCWVLVHVVLPFKIEWQQFLEIIPTTTKVLEMKKFKVTWFIGQRQEQRKWVPSTGHA